MGEGKVQSPLCPHIVRNNHDGYCQGDHFLSRKNIATVAPSRIRGIITVSNTFNLVFWSSLLNGMSKAYGEGASGVNYWPCLESQISAVCTLSVLSCTRTTSSSY